MPTLQDVEGWKGRTVVDPDGDKVGTLEEFYLDRQSGDPTWAAIRTGLFGTHTSLAPSTALPSRATTCSSATRSPR